MSSAVTPVIDTRVVAMDMAAELVGRVVRQKVEARRPRGDQT